MLLYVCCCFFRFPSPLPYHTPIIETAKQDGGSEIHKYQPDDSEIHKYQPVDSADFKWL